LAHGRRIAVLGDMFELGESTADLHYEVGRAAALSGVAWIAALGEQGGRVAAGAAEAGARSNCFASLDDLLTALDAELRVDDWVLVKGSRGMRMERVVRHLSGEVD
jgi:UDP-N-acetylmuramoyl-tripeptide--D-alanyl-D-alanine ligase